MCADNAHNAVEEGFSKFSDRIPHENIEQRIEPRTRITSAGTLAHVWLGRGLRRLHHPRSDY